MTPQQLRAAGLALFGETWQTALAEAVGRSYRQVHRWEKGETPIPEPVAKLIVMMLLEGVE